MSYSVKYRFVPKRSTDFRASPVLLLKFFHRGSIASPGNLMQSPELTVQAQCANWHKKARAEVACGFFGRLCRELSLLR